MQPNKRVSVLKSLMDGSKYVKEDGLKSLYLDGSGAHATTPAVDFGKTSFTIASWVKLSQSPNDDYSPVYSYWQSNSVLQFIFAAYRNNKLFFVMKDINGKSVINEG